MYLLQQLICIEELLNILIWNLQPMDKRVPMLHMLKYRSGTKEGETRLVCSSDLILILILILFLPVSHSDVVERDGRGVVPPAHLRPD